MKKEQEIFRLAEILVKSYREKLTEEETEILQQWLTENPRHQTLYENYAKEEFFREKSKQAADINWQADYEQFMLKHALKGRRLYTEKWIKYAAIFLLPLSLAIYLWLTTPYTSNFSETVQNSESKTSLPVLTLATGQRMILSDSVEIPECEGIRVARQKQGLVYTPPLDSTPWQPAPPVYNCLEIPRGAEYLLTLSDGTTIWLNSESEIRYPVQFNQPQREIFLKGEAFFKVTPDSLHAFIIHTGDATIEVLGTEFNVRNYEDETETATTLVKGSVRLTSGKIHQQLILKPGEQACVTKTNGQLAIREVDTYLYTAWKDSRFVFRHTRMEEILNTLARWYDLVIFYQNPEAKNICFTGDMSRMEDFRQLLNIIENNERVGFTVHGQTVTVVLK